MTNRILLILCFCCLNLAATKAQEKKNLLSLSMKNASLKEILKKIEKQTDYSFVYNETLHLNQKKSVSLKDKSLESVLKVVFQDTGIEWKISGKHILLQNTAHKNTESMPDPDVLSEQSILLEEVVVNGSQSKPFDPTESIELAARDINNTPTVFGEADVMRTLQLLPGIQSGVEGTTGLYVRGGGPDQNLTLLDGINVYNTNHLLGLFSIFNGDIVKKVTLYKGSFPARFGGRLSSVIETQLKDGNMQQYHGCFSIGLLSSRFNLEGPIIKNKTSFNISARRSYIDGVYRVMDMLADDGTIIPIIYFYDLNAKINHKFSDRSRLYLSLYNGKDKVGADIENNAYNSTSSRLEEINYQWGNTIGSLRWNYMVNDKLLANATAAYTNYNFDFVSANSSRQINDLGIPYEYQYTTYQNSGIKDLSLHLDFEYLPGNKHHIRFGTSYIYHTFRPEVHGSRHYEKENEEVTKNQEYTFLNENIIGHETTLYAEDELSLTDKWKANLGAHFSTFTAQNKTYLSLQPRISLGYEYDEKLSFKASYTEMSQYIHLLMSSTVSQPTDLWVPVTAELAPMRAQQVTSGAFYDTRNGYNFSIEGYYKRMSNLLEYRDGATWGTSATPWYEQVESGEGRAYGVELFAQKTTGKLTGWIGYTWAWNDRKFPTINEGRRFPAKYDRRHDLKLNLAYKPSKRIVFSAAWTYATGSNYTLPFEEYPSLSANEVIVSPYINPSQWIERYEERNNYRMKPTHHLDLSLNYYRKLNTKGRQGIWNLTVYNVYNQKCPYMIYPGFNESKGRFVLKQISLLSILPSISYTYKF